MSELQRHPNEHHTAIDDPPKPATAHASAAGEVEGPPRPPHVSPDDEPGADDPAKAPRPMKAIRANCLECSEDRKAVAYCPCDGLHSTRCHFWPYRFGSRPETAVAKYGEAMLTPQMMPGAGVELKDLPGNPRDYRPDIAEKLGEGHGRAD